MVVPGVERAPLEAEVRIDGPVDLRITLGPLRHGRLDPTVRREGPVLWRATTTPIGPATQAVAADPAAGSVRSWAWGPGAPWVLERLSELVGAGDDHAGWLALIEGSPGRAGRPPGWEAVAAMARTHRGLRIPRTASVWEACVPTVLEQKVTGIEAKRAYRDLVTVAGRPAPGPERGLLLPPRPEAVAALASWDFHAMGVERKRAETLRRAASVAARLEEAIGLAPVDARRRLQAVPGLGPWSAAEVAIVALGDPDAVSVGDYHLPNQVAWALAGRARGDDALMLELLEPWRGHRGRVLRLLAVAGVIAPRFGPRQPIRSFRDR